jgi:hypothetical protein
LATASDILQDPNYNGTKKTVLYFHGYTEKLTDDNLKFIINAFITRGTHNLLILDWVELANGNLFLDAIPNALKVIMSLKFVT